MNKKRVIFIILMLPVLAFLLSASVLPVFAASPTFSLDTNAKVYPGDTFTLTFSSTGDTTCKGLVIDLHYSNTSLTLTNVKIESTASVSGKSSNNAEIPYRIAFASSSTVKKGAVVTYTFKLASDAALGDYQIYVDGEYAGSDGKVGTLSPVTKNVSVVCPHEKDANSKLWVQTSHTAATCSAYEETIYRCSECSETKVVRGSKLLEHQLKDYETKKPTCTEDGYVKKICSVCKEIVTISQEKATGHTLSEGTLVPATCVEKGYTLSICSVCGESVRTNETEKAEHQWAESERKEPTCSDGGYIRYTCTVCSQQKDEILKSNPEKHAYEETVIPATCTEKGHTEKLCKLCGQYQLVNNVEPLGHDYQRKDLYPATCTGSGLVDLLCTRCFDHRQETTDPTGHEFGDWHVEVEATEYYEGYEKRVCVRCGLEETQQIPKKNAENENDPTGSDTRTGWQKFVGAVKDAGTLTVVLIGCVLAMLIFGGVFIISQTKRK